MASSQSISELPIIEGETIGIYPYHTNYAVSKTGRVWSKGRGKWKELKRTPQKGYPTATLVGIGRRHVHRMVLETFVGPRPPGLGCRHLDDNKSNNSLSNLIWGTQADNLGDARRNGTAVNPPRLTGTLNHKAKLTEEQVLEIRKRHKPEGEMKRLLATEFGCSQQLIYFITSRRIWKHI